MKPLDILLGRDMTDLLAKYASERDPDIRHEIKVYIADALLDHLQIHAGPRWCCCTCGGTHLEGKANEDANLPGFATGSEDYDPIYCRDCESDVDTVMAVDQWIPKWPREMRVDFADGLVVVSICEHATRGWKVADTASVFEKKLDAEEVGPLMGEVRFTPSDRTFQAKRNVSGEERDFDTLEGALTYLVVGQSKRSK